MRLHYIWTVLGALVIACGLISVAWAFEVRDITNADWELYVWFQKGGLVMYPILLCSILGFGITLERLVALRRRRIIPSRLVEKVEAFSDAGQFAKGLDVCRQYRTPLATIMGRGLERAEQGVPVSETAIEALGQHENTQLTTNLRALGAIAGIAPMLGLLGTVIGMIRAFLMISEFGTGQPNLVAAGITEALITTAAGLVIGILALATYHYLRGRVERLAYEMEAIVLGLIDAWNAGKSSS